MQMTNISSILWNNNYNNKVFIPVSFFNPTLKIKIFVQILFLDFKNKVASKMLAPKIIRNFNFLEKNLAFVALTLFWVF